MSKSKAPAAPAGAAPRLPAPGSPIPSRGYAKPKPPTTQAPGRSGEGASSALEGMKEQQRSKASLRADDARANRPSAR